MKIEPGMVLQITCPECSVVWLAEMNPPWSEENQEYAELLQYFCKPPLGCGYRIDLEDKISGVVEIKE